MSSDYELFRCPQEPLRREASKAGEIRLDIATIRYFKRLSGQHGRFSYRTLINLYLRDCAVGQRN